MEKQEEGKKLGRKSGGRTKIITSTKTGDQGNTSLISGERVSKANARIEVNGNLDESSAALGIAKAFCGDRDGAIRSIVSAIQQHLLILGAEISSMEPERRSSKIGEEHVQQLEEWIESLQEEAPLPRKFVDPGANPVSAGLDLARAVIRRAERSMVTLKEEGQPLRQEALSYVNRLGFLLFVLARYAERHTLPVSAPSE